MSTKKNFNLCDLEGYTGEILGETQCSSEAKNVLKFVTHIKEQFEDEVFVKCGYEAGCLGYALYHSLVALGLHCDILSPTTMLRSAKNKVVKNDKLDARMIAQNLANGTYKAVHVPDSEDVETKEYIRMVSRAMLKCRKRAIENAG